MDVKITNREMDPKLEPHHIYLKNGHVISVRAYRYVVHLNKKAVYFYNSDSKADRNRKIFWSLDEVAGVVAGSALAELPPLVQLQSEVKALTARMDTFESAFAERMDAFEANIGEIIARSVRAGLNSKTQS